MAKIIIRADAAGDEAASITLSERLVADNLESDHYATQLIERITWATREAEEMEHIAPAAAADSKLPSSHRAGRRSAGVGDAVAPRLSARPKPLLR